MMTLGHVQSAQGYGWEVDLGGTAYWFGRSVKGRLLGAFSSVIDLLDAFDHDEGQAVATKPRFDLATDKKMTAEAVSDASAGAGRVVYALKIEGDVVGYCIATPAGALRGLYGDLKSATAAVRAGA